MPVGCFCKPNALIANTDWHYGNILLLLDDDDWTLSPTYGMLPMLHAPVGGELGARQSAGPGVLERGRRGHAYLVRIPCDCH